MRLSVPRGQSARGIGMGHAVGLSGLIVEVTVLTPGAWLADAHSENSRAILTLRGDYVRHSPTHHLLCRPGTLLFWPAYESYTARSSNRPGRVLNIGVTPSAPKELVELAQRRVARLGPSPFGVVAALGLYAEAALKPQPNLARVFELAHELFSDPSEPAGSPPDWLIAARMRLEESMGEHVELKEVASEVAVHPVHLSREFPRFYGVTASEYLRRLRLEHASRRLLDESVSLGDVAEEAGFHDQSHFTRWFRRATGLSPGRLRRATGWGPVEDRAA